jgi:hypothetical protein
LLRNKGSCSWYVFSTEAVRKITGIRSLKDRKHQEEMSESVLFTFQQALSPLLVFTLVD